jgi:hypothetical protein
MTHFPESVAGFHTYPEEREMLKESPRTLGLLMSSVLVVSYYLVAEYASPTIAGIVSMVQLQNVISRHG